MNVADVLFGDDHVCLIPQRKHRYIAADDLLRLRVERRGFGVIVSVSSFVEKLIKLRVFVSASIARGSSFSWNFGRGEQIVIEDWVLITTDPLALGHLKLAAAQEFEQHIQL